MKSDKVLRDSLIKKLGIKPRMQFAFMYSSAVYPETLWTLPKGAEVLQRLGKGLDFLQVFVTRNADLVRQFPGWKNAIDKDGMLWVCWPQKAS